MTGSVLPPPEKPERRTVEPKFGIEPPTRVATMNSWRNLAKLADLVEQVALGLGQRLRA